MSVTKITSKIQTDAEAVAEQIAQQYMQKVTAIDERVKVAMTELQRSYQARCEAGVARDRQETLAKVELGTQLALQQEKRNAVDAVLAKVFQRLQQENETAYQQRYEAILKRLPLQGKTIRQVETAPGRVAVTERLLQDMDMPVSVIADESISAGLRVVTADQQFDCTLDQSFQAARPQLEIEIARTLFA